MPACLGCENQGRIGYALDCIGLPCNTDTMYAMQQADRALLLCMKLFKLHSQEP